MEDMEDMDLTRFYKKSWVRVGFILYEEPLIYNLIDVVTCNFNYYYIKHNKCVTEDGELKKEHYHLLLEFQEKQDISKICKSLKSSLASQIKNLHGSIRYLTHIDNKDKYQYNINDIETNDKNLLRFFKLVDKDNTEINDIKKILDYINNFKPTKKELLHYVLDNSLYASYRRGYSIIKDVLQELKEF